GGARLHGVGRRAAGGEAFLKDELCRLEAGIEIAVAPLFGRLAERQLVVTRGSEITGLPLDGLQVDLRPRHVAVGACVGPAREQAFQWIGDMRQLLEVDLDSLDRLCRNLFALGRDREDRVADVERLVLGEDRGLWRWKLWHVVSRQDAEHALDLERRRRIDAADLGVRDWAGERLAEHHALGTEVLGVFGPASDL